MIVAITTKVTARIHNCVLDVRAGADELRQERDEEHDALRVERRDDVGIREQAPARSGCGCRSGNVGRRDAGAKQPDAEEEQVQTLRSI